MIPTIISNRLPIIPILSDNEINYTFTSGGLSTSLRNLNIKFNWVGWCGIFLEDDQIVEKVKNKMSNDNIYPLFFKKEVFKDYYNGFANKIVWPLFHCLLDKVEYKEKYWKAYIKINKYFAKSIIEKYGMKQTLWIQDYHLFLLPQILREKGFQGKICFFLHIPFPSYEIFHTCPYAKDIILGLSGSNIIGFHTLNYANNYFNSVKEILNTSALYFDKCYIYNTNTIYINNYPIGIYPKQFIDTQNTDTFNININKLEDNFNKYKIILSVDRLDYIKGLFEKLDIFERLLANHNFKDKYILYLVIVPSREEVEKYIELLSEIQSKISKINGKYSSFEGYIPIYFYYQSIPLFNLCALYTYAEVMLITSLRDGMNLVSFEYCACQQKNKNKGLLILSEFTGSSHYLEGAILINPNDINNSANIIYNSIQLDSNTKNNYMDKNITFVLKNTNTYWANNILQEIENININSDNIDSDTIKQISITDNLN